MSDEKESPFLTWGLTIVFFVFFGAIVLAMKYAIDLVFKRDPAMWHHYWYRAIYYSMVVMACTFPFYLHAYGTMIFGDSL